MTSEERVQLNRFLELLTQAQTGPKDAEAEALIADAMRRQPDAGYLLAQRVLQLEHALRDATTQKPSFIGDPNAWGRAPAPERTAAAQPQGRQPGSMTHAAAAPQSRWGSGLMGTVASTAAGVVAGSLLAHGIGSLFGSNSAQAATTDPASVPPGGGTLVETDYGSPKADTGEEYVAGDFDTGGLDDMGDTV